MNLQLPLSLIRIKLANWLRPPPPKRRPPTALEVEMQLRRDLALDRARCYIPTGRDHRPPDPALDAITKIMGGEWKGR